MYIADLERHTPVRNANKLIITGAKQLFTLGASILDCQLGGGEVSPSSQQEIPTSGDVPVAVSYLELRNSYF